MDTIVANSRLSEMEPKNTNIFNISHLDFTRLFVCVISIKFNTSQINTQASQMTQINTKISVRVVEFFILSL